MDIYSELSIPEVHLEWDNVTVSSRYCGTVLPQPRVSLYNYLILGFYSDNVKESKGFEAQYQFLHGGECDIGMYRGAFRGMQTLCT